MLQYGDTSQQAALQGVQPLPTEAGCADGNWQIRHVRPPAATQWPMSVSSFLVVRFF